MNKEDLLFFNKFVKAERIEDNEVTKVYVEEYPNIGVNKVERNTKIGEVTKILQAVGKIEDTEAVDML